MSIILNEYERYLIECEFAINPYPEDAGNIITMDDLVSPFQNIKATDVYLRNNQTTSFSIVGTELIEDRYLILLIQSSNGRASDPAFSNLKTGKSRTVKKEQGEGVAVTAHLLIDTQVQDKLFPNKYLAILEEVPGLTRGMISDILAHFSKNLNFSFVRKGSNESISCRPLFKLDFYASQNFKDSFKKGYLCGITATRSSRYKGLDVNGVEIFEEEKMVVKTSKKLGGKALDVIAKVADIAKEKGYSRLKITRSEDSRKTTSTYDIPDSLDNYDETIADISQATFAKKHKIPLGNSIQSCQNEIHQDLKNAMLRILKGELVS